MRPGLLLCFASISGGDTGQAGFQRAHGGFSHPMDDPAHDGTNSRDVARRSATMPVLCPAGTRNYWLFIRLLIIETRISFIAAM